MMNKIPYRSPGYFGVTYYANYEFFGTLADFVIKKSTPAIRKRGFYTNWRLEAFLYEAAQNFEIFSNSQDQNLKIKNPSQLMSS